MLSLEDILSILKIQMPTSVNSVYTAVASRTEVPKHCRYQVAPESTDRVQTLPDGSDSPPPLPSLPPSPTSPGNNEMRLVFRRCFNTSLPPRLRSHYLLGQTSRDMDVRRHYAIQALNQVAKRSSHLPRKQLGDAKSGILRLEV